MKDFATFIKPTEVPKKSLKRKFKLFFFRLIQDRDGKLKKMHFGQKHPLEVFAGGLKLY